MQRRCGSVREKNRAALLIHLHPANQPAQGTDNGWLCQRPTLLHYDEARRCNHILQHVREQRLYKYLLCVDRLNNNKGGQGGVVHEHD